MTMEWVLLIATSPLWFPVACVALCMLMVALFYVVIGAIIMASWSWDMTFGRLLK